MAGRSLLALREFLDELVREHGTGIKKAPTDVLSVDQQRAKAELKIGDPCAIIDHSAANKLQLGYVKAVDDRVLTIEFVGWRKDHDYNWDGFYPKTSPYILCFLTPAEMEALKQTKHRDENGDVGKLEWIRAFTARQRKYISHIELVSQKIYKAKQEPLPYADVRIQCVDGVVLAHKIVLAASSVTLATALVEMKDEKTEIMTTLSWGAFGVTTNMAEVALKYMYTGQYEPMVGTNINMARFGLCIRVPGFLSQIGQQLAKIEISTQQDLQEALSLARQVRNDESAAELYGHLKTQLQTSLKLHCRKLLF